MRDTSDHEYESPGPPCSEDGPPAGESKPHKGRSDNRGASRRKRGEGYDELELDGQGSKKKPRGASEGDVAGHLAKWTGMGNGRTKEKWCAIWSIGTLLVVPFALLSEWMGAAWG